MERLDRLGWAAGISFRSHGWRLGLRVNRPELLARLPEALPPLSKPSASPAVEHLYSLRQAPPDPRRGVRHFHLLYADVAVAARTRQVDELLDHLASELDRFVAAHSRRRIFVHAGVVGWKGRAIVIPGSSYSGKTTLVRALVERGATLLSDEYAVFDRRGRVHPYPRPLGVREDPEQPPRRLPLDQIGGRVGTRPLPVGRILLTRYRPQTRWRPRSLSRSRSLLELLAHTVPVRSRPEAALEALEAGVRSAVAWRGRRGEAAEVAASLLS